MIVHESGELVKKNLLVLKYEIKIKQEDIYEDVVRMTQECIYHSKAELKTDMPVSYSQSFLMRLFRLAHGQLQSGQEQLKVRINIEPKLRLSITSSGVDERVVKSLNDPMLLTNEEKAKTRALFRRHVDVDIFEY